MDYAYWVAVDKNWNSYIAWSFEQTGVFWDIELTNSGNEDAFISKLAPDWTYLRATKWWWIGDDEAYWVAVDNDWNSYMVWMYNWQSSFWSTTLYGYWERNAFITKVSPTWQFLRVAEGGGNADDRALAVTIDKNWNIYVAWFSQWTSIFWSITLTGDTYGYSNVFIAKISPDWTYQRVTKWWGDSHDFARWIAVDKDWNSYVVWDFFWTATFWATTLISSGSSDTFIAKLAPNWTYLRAVKWWGDNNDIPTSIAIDGWWNIYVAWSLSLIHIWRCRRIERCRSRWSPYH